MYSYCFPGQFLYLIIRWLHEYYKINDYAIYPIDFEKLLGIKIARGGRRVKDLGVIPLGLQTLPLVFDLNHMRIFTRGMCSRHHS